MEHRTIQQRLNPDGFPFPLFSAEGDILLLRVPQ